MGFSIRFSHHVPPLRWGVVLLSCALSLTGCFRSVGPDVDLQKLRNHVEHRVLDDAERAFLRADYSDAIRLLNRFLHKHPQSSRVPEARWWLARSYQESGHLSSAAEQFRLLVHAQTPNQHQAEARSRLSQIEDVGRGTTKRQSIKGILVSLESMRTSANVALVNAANREINGSMVLLNVPCGVKGNGGHETPPFSFTSLTTMIQDMNARGIAVYLGVTLRCLGRFVEGQSETAEFWKDWEYVPQSGTVQRSRYFSLNAPGYREFLVEWLSQFRSLPLRGLILRHEVPVGVYEGMNPMALQSFQQAFNVDFDPVQVFSEGRHVPATVSHTVLPDVFWKWAGWKARERLRLLQNVVETVRDRLPHVRFGIEVQLQSVADPVHGLVHFAEDWIDVTHGSFDVFVTVLQGSRASATHVTAQGSSPPGSEGWDVSLIEQMARSLGRPEKIWTILPSPSPRSLQQSQNLPKGVGRVYDYGAIP